MPAKMAKAPIGAVAKDERGEAFSSVCGVLHRGLGHGFDTTKGADGRGGVTNARVCW